MDFSNLDLSLRRQQASINPIEIFDELPKPEGINDLYASQDRVLAQWFDKRAVQRDTLVKLHTGGGKTLVGLLVGLSSLRESAEPVLYLCPNNELVRQTLAKAHEYSIPAIGWQDSGFHDSFENAESILVANYNHLFNGRSRFGTTGSTKPTKRLGALIIDDAHAGIADLRDAFTYKIRSQDTEAYREFAGLFRSAFEELGQEGSLQEITSGRDQGILEVPYWAWRRQSSQVLELIGSLEARKLPKKSKASTPVDKAEADYRWHNFFVWPFLSNSLHSCHALIASDGVSLTPIMPMVDLVSSYRTCKRRVFMSATLTDDSDVVRTFAVNSDYNVASSPGATGIAERFIISPAYTKLFGSTYEETTKALARFVSSDRKAGVIVITPSRKAADSWKSPGEIVDGAGVGSAVDALRSGESRGPFIFVNRYDGLDLPKDACRLVILWDVPAGTNSYELYRAAMLEGGEELAAHVAQRLEQGMGRGARGAADYCVVVFAGRSLERWIGRNSNRSHFTKATKAQYEIGRTVASSITSLDKLEEAIDQVLSRDKRWTNFHAQRLSAELSNLEDTRASESSHRERQAFGLLVARKFNDAKHAYSTLASSLKDEYFKAWLLQLAARAAEYDDDSMDAERLQMDAVALNDRLPAFPKARKYFPVTVASSQAKRILEVLEDCDPPSAILADFDDDTRLLTSVASSKQFENALEKLGSYLGFATQTPDRTLREGPDVLWLSDKFGFILEAKSQKLPTTKIAKKDAGQLLTSTEWFKKHYPSLKPVSIIVSPSAQLEGNVVLRGCFCLTIAALMKLVQDTRKVYADIVAVSVNQSSVASRLNASALVDSRLAGTYLEEYT